MKVIKNLLLAVIIIILPGVTLATPIHIPYASLYDSKDNLVEVIVAPLKDSDTQALIQIKQVNHDINGIWFLAEITRVSDEFYYSIPWGGETQRIFDYARNRHQYYSNANANTFNVFLPDTKQSFEVNLNKVASKAIETQSIVDEYDKQMSAGIQSSLAKFNRKRYQEIFQKQVNTAINLTQKQCEKQITMNVDFTNISDLGMKNGIRYCTQVLEQLKRLCSKPKYYQDIAGLNVSEVINNINQVNCSTGQNKRISFNPDNKTINWWFVDKDEKYNRICDTCAGPDDQFILYNLITIFNKK